MSSQSSPSLPVRRAAAAFGATAVLCLSMAAPALAVPLPDPSPLQQVPSLTGSASSADQSASEGSSSVPRLGSPDKGVGREVTPQSGSGAGSASSAEGGTPAVTAPSPSSLSLPSV